MPRPRIPRRVWFRPDVTYYKPAGAPMAGLQEVILTMDEFEAIRLKDYEDVSQTEAAKKMGISQPTFQRIYESARKKLADAIVNGKAIRIEGGQYRMMGRGRGFGGGRGRGGRF
ncbi:MAG: DUF134 domain-containing protein [Candidatus Aenigmarchaeota archaeon]|nr:DUF134 domain-containing protein [Candidatus Aenigmarchaeota archaeon]MCK4531831.1 DUF134 domain-containing protein [Candidatus Aenigmarchaeota archaeon]